jgi:Na+/H+ antiporter NhaD/arsenite permease-like protein
VKSGGWNTEFPKAVKAGVVFFLCYLAGFVVSLIRIYSHSRWPDNRVIIFFYNQIFFYIQTALPHSFSTIGDNNHEVISGPPAVILSIIFWLAIGFAFAWFTRRLRLYFTIPLAVIAIFVSLIGAQALLYLCGIQIDVIAP